LGRKKWSKSDRSAGGTRGKGQKKRDRNQRKGFRRTNHPSTVLSFASEKAVAVSYKDRHLE